MSEDTSADSLWRAEFKQYNRNTKLWTSRIQNQKGEEYNPEFTEVLLYIIIEQKLEQKLEQKRAAKDFKRRIALEARGFSKLKNCGNYPYRWNHSMRLTSYR